MKKNNYITALYVYRNDSNDLICQKKTILDDLSTFYKMIDCSVIDIVERRFSGLYYDIICDDEALLRDDISIKDIMAVWEKNPNTERLHRRLLITNHDIDGELASLTEEDIQRILSTKKIIADSTGTHLEVLTYTI